MRPIFGTGGGNVAGANANDANPRPTIAPIRGYQYLRYGGEHIGVGGPPAGNGRDPSNPGWNTGSIARNATFKDSSGSPSYNPLGRPIGAMRFKAPYTGPAAIVVIRPKARGIEYQVTNTDVRHRMPGFTYTLPINVNTKIGQAVRRAYMHTGA